MGHERKKVENHWLRMLQKMNHNLFSCFKYVLINCVFTAPPITANSLRFQITVTILINNPTQQEIASLYQAMRQNLLIPALGALRGYHSVS